MDLLTEHEKYLEAGVHIGTRIATKDMRPFVYKYRKDKLCMLNVEQIDRRIRDAAKFLAKQDLSKAAIIASRVYAVPAAQKFAEIVGAKPYLGRFVPGTFTNPMQKEFSEPGLVFVCDPRIERQALIESTQLGVPTIGLVDSDNTVRNLDFFIPCNNKGKRSIPLIFYLLTREYLKAKGQIQSNEEFKYSISDFELGGGEGEEKVEKEGEHEVAAEGAAVEGGEAGKAAVKAAEAENDSEEAEEDEEEEQK